MFIILRERQRQSMSKGEEEREGETESVAGSRLWAVSTEPNVGFELTGGEIMAWAKVGCLTDWATQAPHYQEALKKIQIQALSRVLHILFCLNDQHS